MSDFKWYYDNDPDRLFEEKNFMAYLDYYHGEVDKGYGKGVRDTEKQVQVTIINKSLIIKKAFRAKEILDSGSNYWYHHRKFNSSRHSKELIRMLQETLDSIDPSFSNEYYKEYYT